MVIKTHSGSDRLLVLCPTRKRPRNVERLKESYYATATDASDLEFIHGDGTCVEKMNTYLDQAWPLDEYAAVMFIGDDHVFTAQGWDEKLIAPLLEGPGIVWPDDQNRYAHPVVWAMSVEIIDALGWFMLPTQKHYYVDDAVYQLAMRAGCGHWLEDVKVPHLHWRITGTPPDDTYLRSESWLVRDREAYWAWMRDESDAAVERVRKVVRS